MHAYLITGFNRQKKEEEITKLIKESSSLRLGFELKKIADVRELNKFVSLSLAQKSAIVIEDVHYASHDAQNAFLKSLEEPQENLIYILTASSQDSVLPTILSRCQLIETREPEVQIEKEMLETVNKFLRFPEGEKLKEVSKITKREEAIEFMKNIILVLHRRLKEDTSQVHSIELAGLTLKRLEANGNVAIQLTNFVINI